MNTRNSFYIQLASNVRHKDLNQSNRVAKFKTILAEKLTLTDDWEVGLAEVSFTYSWYNIYENHSIGVIDSSSRIQLGTDPIFKGYFNSVEELVKEINNKLENSFYGQYHSLPQLSYNKYLNRVVIKTGITQEGPKKRRLFPICDESLQVLLGIREITNFPLANNLETPEMPTCFANRYVGQVKIEPPNIITCKYPVLLNSEFTSVYVYTNIIEPVLIGDTFAKLLRQCEIPNHSEFGDQCVVKYDNLYYFSLCAQEFESIEIELRLDTGDLVPFDFGRSAITLHFRKKLNDERFESLFNIL
jgi:hypothetical protein